MKTWGVGVIGCGAVSRVHLDAIKNMPNARLLAVCDIKPAVADAVAAEHGVRAFYDHREMLKMEGLEIVHISTPHFTHAPIATDAINAGKRVLLEKPIAHDIAQAKELVALAGNKDLAICFQNRYNAASRQAKEWIESGEYGKLKSIRGYVAWHRDSAYYTESDWRGSMATEGGGVLINQAIHTLDLMLWFAGECESVKGSVSTDALTGIIDVEDSAHFTMNFANGTRGVFYATTAYGMDSPIVIEVVLEGATLELHADSLYIIKDGERELVLDNLAQSKGQKSYWGTGHATLIADLYDTFERGEHFWIDAQVGYNALNVLKSVYRSSAENALVTLN